MEETQNERHGMADKLIYSTWRNIKTRCYNKNTHNYKNYGGRGIVMCDRWLNSFSNFYEDMGDKPSSKYSIDRIDNDKGYSKENCRWASSKDQARNRSNNLILKYNGESMAAFDWCKRLGIRNQTLWIRLNRLGWSLERALTTKNNNKKIT